MLVSKSPVRLPFCVRSVLILGATLTPVPAISTPQGVASAPLGSVLVADDGARLDSKLALAGASMYDGDRLETDDNSSLHVLLDKAQIYLGASTQVEVHSAPKGFTATLVQGTVIVLSPEGRTFQLVWHSSTIRPLSTAATRARASWLSPDGLFLSSDRGGIQVSFDDNTRTIEAGTSLVIRGHDSDPPNDGGHPQSLPTPPGHINPMRVVIPISIVIPVVILLALMSPTCP